MRFSWISATLLVLSCASPPPRSAECVSTPTPTSTPTSTPEPAPSSTTTPAIPFDMPKAGEFRGQPAVAPPPGVTYEDVKPILVITIDKDGKLYFEAKVVDDPQELVKLTRSQMERDQDTRVVIRADRLATWASVVTALDLMRQGGASKIAFAVEPLPR